MNSKEELLQIIQSSILNEEDKKKWESVINILPESSLDSIREVLKAPNSSSPLLLLTLNLNNKIKALQSQDPHAWEQALLDDSKVFSSK